MADFYEVLGVSKDATPDEIDKAYRRMARKHHPDHGGDAEAFKAIAVAYGVLSNAESRDRYDATGDAPGPRQAVSKVEQTIAAMLLDAFMDERRDPIRWMLERLDRNRASASKQRDEIIGGKAKLQRRLDKFRAGNAKTKNEPGRDFIIMGLQSRIAEADAGIALMDSDMQHFTDTMAFLNDLKSGDSPERSLYTSFPLGTATFHWGDQ